MLPQSWQTLDDKLLMIRCSVVDGSYLEAQIKNDMKLCSRVLLFST